MTDTMTQKIKNDNEKFCADCAAVISAKAEICPKCGVRQISSVGGFASAPNGKNRMTAILLAFFLGGFGIHKFYLGQAGKGIMYLLFCWTFIPAILAFIEVILLIVMSDSEFIRKYGHV